MYLNVHAHVFKRLMQRMITKLILLKVVRDSKLIEKNLKVILYFRFKKIP
jgi:hypothetical protein